MNFSVSGGQKKLLSCGLLGEISSQFKTMSLGEGENPSQQPKSYLYSPLEKSSLPNLHPLLSKVSLVLYIHDINYKDIEIKQHSQVTYLDCVMN